MRRSTEQYHYELVVSNALLQCLVHRWHILLRKDQQFRVARNCLLRNRIASEVCASLWVRYSAELEVLVCI